MIDMIRKRIEAILVEEGLELKRALDDWNMAKADVKESRDSELMEVYGMTDRDRILCTAEKILHTHYGVHYGCKLALYELDDIEEELKG